MIRIFMHLELQPIDIPQIQEERILQQTSFWACVKQNQGIPSKAFYLEHNAANQPVQEDMLVTLQPVDSEHYIAYVPYGPKNEVQQGLEGAFIEELSEELKHVLPNGCITVRYDLPWENLWAQEQEYFSDEGIWLGPPDVPMQEMRLNYGTAQQNIYKAASNNLPAHTIFMCLQNDENELLTQMKPKTRYNIRLAMRHGVVVRQAGLEEVDTWYRLYTETAQRNGIYLHDKSYFITVLQAKANDAANDADVQILIAEKEGIPLAAMFLALSEDRGTYLYGASGSTNRKYMATYALQWHAMLLAQKHGCHEYDLFGIAPTPQTAHPLHGLYRFKTGFGGSVYHRMGCWDYPYDSDKYQILRAKEMCAAGYHL
jgi:lipid II:glycine glycyltransferase (peptidoglycan interpeptide bridge formation enzyme)